VHIRQILAAVLFTALSIRASAAAAQTSDALAFRRGQWGTEFTVSSGFTAVGVLRFNSPTRALFINVSGLITHQTSSNTVAYPSGDTRRVDVRLGSRSYRALEPRVYRMVTLGLIANYTFSRLEHGTSRVTDEVFGGGVFGEIGATWLVTPHLGLGAKAEATLGYGHRRDGHALTLEVGTVRLAGQVYF